MEEYKNYFRNIGEDISLNKSAKAKIDKLYNVYKEQVQKEKGGLDSLNYKIKTNFVNNKYARVSNQEIDYIWSLYKKETKKSLNERVSGNDDILKAITYEELMDTVHSNEKEITEKAILKVYKEILKMNSDDALYELKKNMKNLLTW
jgi:DNA mismatch repair ATPase MutS